MANIVLTGMPASGKTTVGRELAKKLGREFVDIDEEIEKGGKMIAQIFEQYGEEYFRKLESDVVKRVMQAKNLVIALGGGGFQDERVRKMLLENAFVIYLKTPLDVLKSRVAQKSHRPLTDLDGLYAARAANYERAHLIAEVDDD